MPVPRFALCNRRIKVYKSNVVQSDLNPTWNEVTLDIEGICNGDLEHPMKIVVWDHRRSGNHKRIGEFETTIRQRKL